MLYDLLVVQDKRQLKNLFVRALPVFAAPSGTKQHLVDVIMKALLEDANIEGIYTSILSCFSVEYLKCWIRSHVKGGARGAKTKIELISVFLVLDRTNDGVEATDMPMPPEPPLMQLVPRDEQIKTVKKSKIRGSKEPSSWTVRTNPR